MSGKLKRIEGGLLMVEEKDPINSISAVGIIVRKKNRRQIFMEMKTADYPRRTFAELGLIPGGNWIGEKAKGDMGPRDTLVREWGEEITFEKPIANFHELNLLFSERRLGTYQVKGSDWKASESELRELAHIKDVVAAGYVPFGDYLQLVPEEVFRRGEPEYSKGDWRGICSVWQVELLESDWNLLVKLQNLAGNLSNESITVIRSLDEILKTRWNVAWGHDTILKKFFLEGGFKEAKDFPLVPGITTEWLGAPLADYNKYLRLYEVEKRP
jgi:hypothetical protein